MKTTPLLASLLTAWALVACGGGGDSTDNSAAATPSDPAASTPAPAPSASAPAPAPAAPTPAVAPAANAKTDLRAIDLNENCQDTGALSLSPKHCTKGTVWGKATDANDQLISENGADVDCVVNVSDTQVDLSFRNANYRLQTTPLVAVTDVNNDLSLLTTLTGTFTNDTTGNIRTLSHEAKNADGSNKATIDITATKQADGSYRYLAKSTATNKAGDKTDVNDTYNVTSTTGAMGCLATIAPAPVVTAAP